MDIFEVFRQDKVLCLFCGVYFDTIRESRKHNLAFHYDYVLAQCWGNHELLKQWASENE